jgi:NADH-quinone oxidoreductase subunit N
MLNVAVSLYYYLQVVRAAYLLEPAGQLQDLRVSVPIKALTGLLIVAIVVTGIYPTQLLQLARAAVDFLI